MRYVILVMTLLLMNFQVSAEEFVDKRFYRIQKSFAAVGDLKLTPEKGIISYSRNSHSETIDKCQLLENKIGKIHMKCQQPNEIYDVNLIFEITHKVRYADKKMVYVVKEQNYDKTRIIEVLPEDNYDTPECLDFFCQEDEEIFNPKKFLEQQEFIDKRFYRIQKQNSSQNKVTPEEIIVGYDDGDNFKIIVGNCQLLENKIGKIRMQCWTQQWCDESGLCNSEVEYIYEDVTYEITHKYWDNGLVYAVSETGVYGRNEDTGSYTIQTIDVLPEDDYDTPECLDSSCTEGKGVYKPGELWTKKSLKPQRIKKVPLFKNNP